MPLDGFVAASIPSSTTKGVFTRAPIARTGSSARRYRLILSEVANKASETPWSSRVVIDLISTLVPQVLLNTRDITERDFGTSLLAPVWHTSICLVIITWRIIGVEAFSHKVRSNSRSGEEPGFHSTYVLKVHRALVNKHLR